MSHLRSPRAMIWPTLRAIEFPPWLAREAHNRRTHAVTKTRIFSLIEKGMADRPISRAEFCRWGTKRPCPAPMKLDAKAITLGRTMSESGMSQECSHQGLPRPRHLRSQACLNDHR